MSGPFFLSFLLTCRVWGGLIKAEESGADGFDARLGGAFMVDVDVGEIEKK